MTSAQLRGQFPMSDSIVLTVATSKLWAWVINPAQNMRINGVALTPTPASVGHVAGCIGTLGPNFVISNADGAATLLNGGNPVTAGAIPTVDGLLLGNRARVVGGTPAPFSADGVPIPAPLQALNFEYRNDWTALPRLERPRINGQTDSVIVMVLALDALTNYEVGFAIDALPEGDFSY